MNLLNSILAISFFVITTSCSFFKEKPSDVVENPSFVKEVRVVSNSVATPVEISDEGSSFVLEGSNESVAQADKPVTVMSDKPERETVMTAPVATTKGFSGKSKLKSNRNRRPSSDGQFAQSTRLKSSDQYQVNSGDTLMKIAFEHYGDLSKWHAIYEMNKDMIKQFNTIYPGMILKLGKDEFVVIERNGKPYLIRRNDTLMGISNILYGNISDWKLLWQNNRQLIHNPNKIYAGFKLYYLPK